MKNADLLRTLQSKYDAFILNSIYETADLTAVKNAFCPCLGTVSGSVKPIAPKGNMVVFKHHYEGFDRICSIKFERMTYVNEIVAIDDTNPEGERDWMSNDFCVDLTTVLTLLEDLQRQWDEVCNKEEL